jgi:hypothetical protein
VGKASTGVTQGRLRCNRVAPTAPISNSAAHFGLDLKPGPLPGRTMVCVAVGPESPRSPCAMESFGYQPPKAETSYAF